MKIKRWIIGIFALTFVFVTALGLVACKDGKSDENNERTAEDKGMAFITLDINPSVELVVDGSNTVTSVYGANEDGLVLLYREDGIVGEDVTTAIDKIVNLAVELGYLNEENHTVDVSVSAEKETTATELGATVNAKVTATAKNLGLDVTTTAEGAYSELQKLKELKESYPDNPAIQALELSKFKLVASATEDGKIDVETAVELDDSKLIKMVDEAHRETREYATYEYKKAVAEAEAVYEKAVEIAKEGVYSAYYLKKVIFKPMTAYHGSLYCLSSVTAKGLELVAGVFEYIEDERNYPLDETRVTKILGALGLTADEVGKIQNSDGDVTIASVEAYIDKMVKNTKLYGDFTAIKTEVEATLTDAKAYVKGVVADVKIEYADQIESLVEIGESSINTIRQTIGAIPVVADMLNEGIGACEAVVAEIKSKLQDGTLTAEELRESAAKLREKAEEHRIEADVEFSESELEAIRADQEKVVATLASKKQSFDKAVEEAKQKAQEKLERLKNDRRKA